MILHVSGPVDIEAVARYVDQHVEDLLPYETLWDIRACDLSALVYADWKWLLSHTRTAAEQARDRRLAILCGSTLQFGLSRMLEELAGVTRFPVTIRAFRVQEQAESWLIEGLRARSPNSADV